jgi:multisubunit Na+/H+ antiporter MnhE subunit
MAMSSLPTLHPAFRPHAARLGLVTAFAVLLVFLGFLVPFWIVLIVATAVVVIARSVHAVRTASAKVDRILAEELPPNDGTR